MFSLIVASLYCLASSSLLGNSMDFINSRTLLANFKSPLGLIPLHSTPSTSLSFRCSKSFSKLLNSILPSLPGMYSGLVIVKSSGKPKASSLVRLSATASLAFAIKSIYLLSASSGLIILLACCHRLTSGITYFPSWQNSGTFTSASFSGKITLIFSLINFSYVPLNILLNDSLTSSISKSISMQSGRLLYSFSIC